MAREKRNLREILGDEILDRRPRPSSHISQELAHKLIVAQERLQAFYDQAERKEKIAAGGKGLEGQKITEKWRFHGFMEGVEVAQYELRDLMCSLVDTEDPDLAEKLVRSIATGR